MSTAFWLGISLSGLSMVILTGIITAIIMKRVGKEQQWEINQQTQQTLFTESLQHFHEQLGKLTQTVQEQLSSNHHHMQTVNQVYGKIGELSEATKNLQALGANVTELQNILKAPKLRGNLGETLLEELLRQMIPGSHYRIKYLYPSGLQVDAAIFLKDKFIPIDAKFPLESFVRMQQAATPNEEKVARRSFVRSVKERVKEIADKYIAPHHGSYDFAILYIPAENIFYDIITCNTWEEAENPILSYAMERKVILTSPNSFYAYLLALAYGLNGLRIEARTQEIQGKIASLQEAFSRFSEDFNTLGSHLERAGKKYQEANLKAQKINDRLTLTLHESEESRSLLQTATPIAAKPVVLGTPEPSQSEHLLPSN